MSEKRIFVSADHGLALIYFLQSQLVPRMVEAGVHVIMLIHEDLRVELEKKFGFDGLTFEGLRIAQAKAYARRSQELQWWLSFLGRVGGSNRINTRAMDSYVEQVWVEEPNRRRMLMPAGWGAIAGLRRSRLIRRAVLRAQELFTPDIYGDLFESFKPDLVVGSTPGWRLDRYLLREAVARGTPTTSMIVGWDNSSSYGLPGAGVEHINSWSAIQAEELHLGSDWPRERINVGGIPSYDGYFLKEWEIPRETYFQRHGLDPNRKLLSYACSFVSFSPSIQNVEALCRLVNSGTLAEPCQLLIRLHPNHFLNVHLFSEERDRIRSLADEYAHVHVVEPIPLAGHMGHYSGEDTPEKASMMAHSDVFITVYSTMVVEAAIHERPIISACIDMPGGWNWPRKYSLPLSSIGNWPTHDRFRKAGAGRVAHTESELREAINEYLEDPHMDSESRLNFVKQEVTFLDGTAGRRTADYLVSLI